MVWVPAVSDATVKVAAPFDREAVPINVEPSSNVTVPEGVAPAAAVTPTVKVTDWPTFTWVADAERVVVVAGAAAVSGCTTNITAE
jgi:hypothetical protein